MPLIVPAAVAVAFAPIRKLIRDEFARFSQVPGLIHVRPGYAYPPGSKPTPAIVIAVDPANLADAEKAAADLTKRLSVVVDAVAATPVEQLAAAAGAVAFAPGGSDFDRFLDRVDVPSFGPPRIGSYKPPPGLKLDEVADEMDVTLSASPEGGWPLLRQFLSETSTKMTVAMYQFTAPHIFEALSNSLSRSGGSLQLALHPIPESIQKGGVKKDDVYEPELVGALQQKLADRFDWAWTSVGKNGVFGSAYHIKVAVADGNRFWLSSGNWQSSNQPAATPPNVPAGYQRNYNRDYHAVIRHAGLAGLFEKFIQYDLRVARLEGPHGTPKPDLLVPLPEEPPSFAPPEYHGAPKVLPRKARRVQPVLTPDNYVESVLPVIAAARKRLYFQNQYINLNASGDLPGFEKLVAALLDRQRELEEVYIICRDMMASDKLDMLVALGFDAGRIRFQPACHCKAILVDGRQVVLGSHNWSNEGTVSNRDASLIFPDDEEVAAYFEPI